MRLALLLTTVRPIFSFRIVVRSLGELFCMGKPVKG
ncbi:hypothetical protein RDI58_022132 [Solanum bulbocastanum]|uniref:Uncharacterized protein n=1 Tax=Solanum bulbocastanum TaxID=147425 RepID=A0AAN8T8T0_SOLBU